MSDLFDLPFEEEEEDGSTTDEQLPTNDTRMPTRNEAGIVTIAGFFNGNQATSW